MKVAIPVETATTTPEGRRRRKDAVEASGVAVGQSIRAMVASRSVDRRESPGIEAEDTSIPAV
jgi:hypothetical protein